VPRCEIGEIGGCQPLASTATEFTRGDPGWFTRGDHSARFSCLFYSRDEIAGRYKASPASADELGMAAIFTAADVGHLIHAKAASKQKNKKLLCS